MNIVRFLMTLNRDLIMLSLTITFRLGIGNVANVIKDPAIMLSLLDLLCICFQQLSGRFYQPSQFKSSGSSGRDGISSKVLKVERIHACSTSTPRLLDK